MYNLKFKITSTSNVKRLIFFFTIIIFLINKSYSQSLSELNQKAIEYYNNKDYQKAIEYAEKLKVLIENELGKENINYGIILDNLGLFNSKNRNYKVAEPLFIEALSIKRNSVGVNHPIYATSLNNLALMYFEMGNYLKAEPFYIEAITIRKKVLGEFHPDYATCLNDLALMYTEMGDYKKAEPLYFETILIRKKILGENHPDYASSINNLAMLYYLKGNYIKAESLYTESMSIRKKVLGEDHPDYATSLSNLALLYSNVGNYVKSEHLYLDAKSIRLKTVGQNHPDFANTIDNLATLYSYIGNYSEAEQLYIESTAIRKKTLGENHPDYAKSLNNLASLYDKMGYYGKAEPLYIEAIGIIKKALGENHMYYATSLNNLAIFYINIGNYIKSESFLIESNEIIKKALGENHSNYANSLINLGGLYSEMGKYDKVVFLYIEAISILKKTQGESHPDVANPLNLLAFIYIELGNYTKAESLLIEAITIQKNALNDDHPDIARSLHNMALLYSKTGNFMKAEKLYSDVKDIRKKVLGVNHPSYVSNLDNFMMLYFDIGNYSKAEPLLLEANNCLNNQINLNFSFLSEKEKEQFLTNNINYHFNLYNSYILSRIEQNPSITAVSYNNELSHKGMLLHGNIALRQTIYSSGDKILMDTYNQFIGIHKAISSLYLKPMAERNLNIDSLENYANTLEKELLKTIKDFPDYENITGLTEVKWQDVQQVLKSDEVAIEFINFNYYNKNWTDSTFYCALVLRKEYNYPKMIYLFEEKQLQELISTSKATINANYITQLYSYNSKLTSEDLTVKNPVYNLVWQPIEDLLSGITTVYLAPSGLLNKVAFNAIPVSDSTYLLDKYTVNLVSSTRILTKTRKQSQFILNDYKAILYGGIEYDVDSTKMASLANESQKPELLLASRSFNLPENNRGVSWPFLSGTLTEVQSIDKIFKTKQISSTLYSGVTATEESFKYLAKLVKSPEIIHFATHGFFFPEIRIKSSELQNIVYRESSSTKPSYIHAENPLFRSGILLAGAGRAWENLQPIPGVEDGTLTAYEVSNMNLRNTKLVVLSACETGLGDIKGSEGVYGLQRAFKMAGVQYIIMSLWQVPDYQTAELMKHFYTNFLNGMEIYESFKAAQQTMRKKYDPFYWAAFVLME